MSATPKKELSPLLVLLLFGFLLCLAGVLLAAFVWSGAGPWDRSQLFTP